MNTFKAMMVLGLWMTMLGTPAQADRIRVENRIEVPAEALAVDPELPRAELIADSVLFNPHNQYLIVENPRLKFDVPYHGYTELPMTNRNITVSNLCQLLGVKHWNMLVSQYQAVKWKDAGDRPVASVMLNSPSLSSFEMVPERWESPSEGYIKTLACRRIAFD